MLRRNLQQSAPGRLSAQIADLRKTAQTGPKRRRSADFGSNRRRAAAKLRAEATLTMRLRH